MYSPSFDADCLAVALTASRLSKDPSTKVGAVLADSLYNILNVGWNQFPDKIAVDARMHDRILKNDLIVHAEQQCLSLAAKHGQRIAGSTLYVVATNDKAEVWGGPPCIRCTVAAINAGVIAFVSHQFKNAPSRWQASIELSRKIIHEAGLEYREYEAPNLEKVKLDA